MPRTSLSAFRLHREHAGHQRSRGQRMERSSSTPTQPRSQVTNLTHPGARHRRMAPAMAALLSHSGYQACLAPGRNSSSPTSHRRHLRGPIYGRYETMCALTFLVLVRGSGRVTPLLTDTGSGTRSRSAIQLLQPDLFCFILHRV